MTKEDIAEVRNAINEVGLNCTKFPKRLEVRIPKVKYPGVYFSIPTDIKSLKIQVYFHQTSFSYFEKIKTTGYTVGGEDLFKIIYLNEVKGIPAQEEIEEYLKEALEKAKSLGIVHIPNIQVTEETEA